MPLTRELREHAVKHGVDLIGVASAEAFKVDGELMDPRAYLKGGKSVVVYGFYFGSPLTESLKSSAPRGKLSPGLGAFSAMDEHCYEIIKEYLNEKGYNAVKKNTGKI